MHLGIGVLLEDCQELLDEHLRAAAAPLRGRVFAQQQQQRLLAPASVSAAYCRTISSGETATHWPGPVDEVAANSLVRRIAEERRDLFPVAEPQQRYGGAGPCAAPPGRVACPRDCCPERNRARPPATSPVRRHSAATREKPGQTAPGSRRTRTGVKRSARSAQTRQNVGCAKPFAGGAGRIAGDAAYGHDKPVLNALHGVDPIPDDKRIRLGKHRRHVSGDRVPLRIVGRYTRGPSRAKVRLMRPAAP